VGWTSLCSLRFQYPTVYNSESALHIKAAMKYNKDDQELYGADSLRKSEPHGVDFEFERE
jgi:hypothetical protein